MTSKDIYDLKRSLTEKWYAVAPFSSIAIDAFYLETGELSVRCNIEWVCKGELKEKSCCANYGSDFMVPEVMIREALETLSAIYYGSIMSSETIYHI